MPLISSMTKLTLVCFLCLTGLYLPCSLFAQTQHTIYGTVRQPDGSPAKSASVDISGDLGMRLRTYADDLGRYELSGILRGTYRLIAENPADSSQTMEPIDIDTGRFIGARIMININLQYAAHVKAPKANPSAAISIGEEAEQVPKPAQKAFDKAIELRGKKKLDDALKSFTEAVFGDSIPHSIVSGCPGSNCSVQIQALQHRRRSLSPPS